MLFFCFLFFVFPGDSRRIWRRNCRFGLPLSVKPFCGLSDLLPRGPSKLVKRLELLWWVGYPTNGNRSATEYT